MWLYFCCCFLLNLLHLKTLYAHSSLINVCILVGKAGEMIDRGDNTYGGKYVVNPSGGLISKGHPLGATGKKENGVLYVLERFGGPFMLFLSSFCYAFVRVCLLMPCGHLLGKG